MMMTMNLIDLPMSILLFYLHDDFVLNTCFLDGHKGGGDYSILQSRDGAIISNES